MNIKNLFGTPMPKFNTCTEAIADYFKRNGSLDQLECCKLFYNWNLHKVVKSLELHHNMKFENVKKLVKTQYGKTTEVTVYKLIK